MGVTNQLAVFIVKTEFNDIPEEAIILSKKHFLDCLGTMIAGYEEEAGKIVTDYIKEVGGTPESRLVGSGIFTSAANSAFANGTMAHVLDFDDTGFSHPTACILPVLLGLGEKHKLTGEEILLAQVMGYECFGKLSYGARPYEPTLRTRGYHPTPVWGTLAAAATAAKLLKLDVNKTKMAMGIAGSQAAGLVENFGTMSKGFHCGNAARAGVLATLLAQKGFMASKNIIEGEHGLYHALVGKGNYDLTRIRDTLGKNWEIVTPGLAIKRYPCCGGSLRAVDAILQIIRDHNLSFTQIKSVDVEMSTQLKDTLRFEKPTKGYQGKFSMEYIMAAAILDGKVDIDSFSDEKATSSRMREAVQKVNVTIRSEWDSKVARTYTPVKVRTENGQEYLNLVERQKGHPENPITREELQDKYRYCAKKTLPKDKIERSIDLVNNLEKVVNITSLMDLVTIS